MRGRLVEQSAGLKAWRDQIIIAAKTAMRKERRKWPYEGPVAALMVFWLPNSPVARPDLDKLVRAVGDALTSAGAIRDDSQIVALMARKDKAPRNACGVVTVLSIPDEDEAPGNQEDGQK
jgi:Holliday junction resolvase RusA-like endonuclease